MSALPTTTLLVANMHCTSCCDAIDSLLATLPPVRNVTTSLLHRTVTFSVDTSAAHSSSKTPPSVPRVINQVVHKLTGEGGFAVEADGEAEHPPAREAPSLLGRLGLQTRRGRERKRAEDRRRRHLEHCEVCQAQEREQAERSSPLSTPSHSLQAPLAPQNAAQHDGIVKTTLSIEGMTCASCTSAITNTLNDNPDIEQVDINLLNSSGVVRHKALLPAADIAEMISDTGYETEVVESHSETSVAPSAPGSQVKTVLSIEGMTCASCSSAITDGLSKHPNVTSVEINLLGSSGVVLHNQSLTPDDVKDIVDDLGYDAQVVSSETAVEENGDAKIKSTFAIEGMTCASCSSAINSAFRGMEGIESCDIDLLNNRGVIVHASNITAGDLAEQIEDLGYGAEISTSEPVSFPSKGKGKEETLQRTVKIHVEGLFCHQCVSKINHHLSTLPLLSHSDIALHPSIITVTYVPHDPLTIRDILESLTGLAPEFEASVFKAPSLSERSRDIQKKEVRMLARHLAVAVVFAIPTFVIAIVGMVLLKGHDAFKMKMMESTWGAANLGTVILWPLATVVQFGVGRIFYQRAFASLWPHLRGLLPKTLIPKNQRRLPKRPLTWRSAFSFGSMDLLVVLSTTVSYFASIAMLAIDVQNPSGTDSVGTYFDSCVFLIMFILLGRTLEAYAKSRTTDAVSLLGGLRPDTALLVGAPTQASVEKEEETSSVDSHETVTGEGLKKETSHSTDTSPGSSATPQSRKIPIDHLEIGDLLLLPPGSLPPTDAVLVSGTTTFDESSLTGESKPIHKHPGDEIFTGTVNLSSAVTVRVLRLGGDTMIEKIIRAVSDAASRKAPLEKLAEKLTGVFVPVIVYLSLIVLAVWLPLALTNTVEPHSVAGGKVFFALEFAISTLVVACPCGIGLAVPCANAVGNGVAAKAGIIASGGGEAFLGATKISRVVFDKTGTLTVGRSEVMNEVWEGAASGNKENRQRIIRGVLELERASTHPLAVGMVEYLEKSPLAPSGERVEVVDTEEIAGRGLKASLRIGQISIDLLVGNVALMTDHNVAISEQAHVTVSTWSTEAKSVILIAMSDSPGSYALSALYSLSDHPRPEAAEVIASLRKRGIAVNMLSGDNETTARAVGKMIGLGENEVKGGVGPKGKAETIRIFQAGEGANEKMQGKDERRKDVVMFIGDGLNDAVALAAADVSVAMGHGSQATLASADFVLLSSSLNSLVPLLRISRKVINRQKLNLGWAIIFNVVCLPFAAGVFYGAGKIRLTPVWSAVLMALSSVSVVCSSLAMRWGL
ncbi:hypothetical protein, variant [Cryptococcus amylolentus CBS 6039]|uniref:HMA domain-containing protein n=1 Tax=Cryptococcus amylolentus CBS 6039 TaxID=1295533 RepID=A0A1E3HZQ1_9TREE|nr:hypothetical protein, variant [Cryptococcus amylolentus CBS 6039]ODN81790.1 hypothetical protein, variant [Cryptococcus amylolentus CBS 6039]